MTLQMETTKARHHLGVLIRYADDHVILCRTQRDAEEALNLLRAIMDRLELGLHPEKTRLVDLRNGKEGFDFLGFHCRKKKSWRWQKYYLNYWPSSKAQKAIRGKIRKILGARNQLWRDLENLIQVLNPILRGWGAYFRKGNSSRQFRSIDSYVTERLLLFLSKKRRKIGRNWSQGMKEIRTSGIYRLSGKVQWHTAKAPA